MVVATPWPRRLRSSGRPIGRQVTAEFIIDKQIHSVGVTRVPDFQRTQASRTRFGVMNRVSRPCCSSGRFASRIAARFWLMARVGMDATVGSGDSKRLHPVTPFGTYDIPWQLRGEEWFCFRWRSPHHTDDETSHAPVGHSHRYPSHNARVFQNRQ